MPTSHRKLADLQQWMQSVITHPDGVEAGIAAEATRAVIDVDQGHVTDVVTRSRDRTATERLEVYGNAYFGRLLECMRELFPALVFALEQDLFDQFAVGYLQRYPSQSYTLAELADRFVEYLEATSREWFADDVQDDSESADGSSDSGPSTDWPDFIIDLARLEWTIDQVFDGAGVENEKVLSAEDLQDLSADEWASARLIPVCCLRLLAFKYPVNEYFSMIRHGESPELPEPNDAFVAITRRDYIVRRLDLSRAQYELLAALIDGCNIGEALAQAAETTDDVDALTASLQNWFFNWSAERLFQRVELSNAN